MKIQMSTSTREGFCSLLCHCAPTKKKTTDSDIGRASSVVFIGDEKLEKMQKYKHLQTAGEENE